MTRNKAFAKIKSLEKLLNKWMAKTTTTEKYGEDRRRIQFPDLPHNNI